MGAFFVYIVKSAVCLAVFYLFYRLLLSRETFHRFNRITFSYNLPKSLLNTLTLKDASIFFQAENMLTLAKQQGLDPEQTFGGSTYYRYPAMKTISFGINVKL